MTEHELFEAARQIDDGSERAAFLDSACGGDQALHARVEALLRAYARAGSFLATPALAAGAVGGPLADNTRTEPTALHSDQPLDFLSPTDKPGSLGRLGHYEIQEIIGKGGMGVVLKAFDEDLHRVVAIKAMAPQLATTATAQQRFVREARAAAAVTHDHIVTIHAVEQADGLPYIVMQCVAGVSLQERLDRAGALPLVEILRIGMQTATGLAAAHAQGLVHRDIKPANILLENGIERVKITDFGLARAGHEASVTQAGVVAGTPHYMSPEQAEGKPLDQRTDLFSLGSVLYAMCTGHAPFRAHGTMAVLKRVCEEMPTPIRETNPAIPDWLVAIIDKLHAKDPAERYQSAAQVADVLGRNLARVQHPPLAPMSSLARRGGREQRSHARSRGRFAVAAAVLLLALGSLSVTEATGVTKLRATMIRIFTADGTLRVEIDDPGVKVTVENDGGLVITAAGLEEIRLRPGNYRVHADRNGKPVPLERELVSIARWGRETVKVSLEGAPPPSGAKVETGAFVVLGGKGVAERRFDTLAEAVQGSSAGDTIEIRSNGPFVSDGVTIWQPVVIRAGEGYAPSITLSQAAADRNTPLLTTSTSLVLEGLELRRIGGAKGESEGRFPSLLVLDRATLHASNCRFVMNNGWNCYMINSKSPEFTFCNCHFSTDGECAVVWFCPPEGRGTIENCVSAVGVLTSLSPQGPEVKDINIHIRRNTTVGRCLVLNVSQTRKPAGDPPIRLGFAANVANCPPGFFNSAMLGVIQWWLEPSLSARDAEGFLRAFVALLEQNNVYMVATRMLHHTVYSKTTGMTTLEASQGKDLADWKRFWNQPDTGSVEGTVRFQGGDLLHKALTAPEKLTADDFRLRPDSAGYKAGKDGKDLGADVDRVGPGAAYDRWKKTPEYQKWLKETGQIK